MAAPQFSAADYLAALQNLLPRGKVWPRDPDATLTATLSGLAPTLERNNGRAVDLLTDAFPANTTELLPEWESSLGLPDPCAGEAPTVEERRAQVLAKLTTSGGQSAAFFEAYAAQVGIEIEVVEHSPFRCGVGKMGDPVGGAEWAFSWEVQANTDGIGEFGQTVLECQFEALKPAHTAFYLTLYTYLDTESGDNLVTESGVPFII